MQFFKWDEILLIEKMSGSSPRMFLRLPDSDSNKYVEKNTQRTSIETQTIKYIMWRNLLTENKNEAQFGLK